MIDLIGNVIKLEFGSDLLAGISIVTAVLLGEYLAGMDDTYLAFWAERIKVTDLLKRVKEMASPPR